VTTYVALTAYGVPVVQAPMRDRKTALAWADQHGDRWPGARIIQLTARGPRTIWRHTEQELAA
jgi:hypothetical protein